MWCVQAFVLAALWMSSGVSAQGSWQTVVQNAGISTMHCAVTHYGNVILLDRTNIGNSQLPLPAGHVCRKNPLDRVSSCTSAVVATAHRRFVNSGTSDLMSLATNELDMLPKSGTGCSTLSFLLRRPKFRALILQLSPHRWH